MKNLICLLGALFVFGFSTLSARDLTYRLGVGYSQRSIYAVQEGAKTGALTQLNGIEASFGLAKDMQAMAWFGFSPAMDYTATGVGFRYDLQRLFNQDASIWQNLNIFAMVDFMAKIGKDQEKGVSLRVPAIGFEVLPFDRNNFAISTNFGLLMDFGGESKLSLSGGQFGDVGVKYYF